MYTQMAFVTSVRGMTFLPQTAANASLSFFGAKMPFPAFFMAAAIFLPFAFAAFLPIARFSAVIFLRVAFVMVVFVVVVVATVVFVVVVIVMEEWEMHALSLEPKWLRWVAFVMVVFVVVVV